MTDDAISAAARSMLIYSAIDLKVQLEKGTGTRPMLYFLASQRNKAVDAMRKMVEIDPSETGAITALQNEVRLYGDLMEAARDMLSRGREADWEMHQEDLDAIRDFLTTEEAQALGITPASED